MEPIIVNIIAQHGRYIVRSYQRADGSVTYDAADTESPAVSLGFGSIASAVEWIREQDPPVLSVPTKLWPRRDTSR